MSTIIIFKEVYSKKLVSNKQKENCVIIITEDNYLNEVYKISQVLFIDE